MKLKQCPFCGGDSFTYESKPFTLANCEIIYVRCVKCEACGPTVEAPYIIAVETGKWESAAGEAWNRRVE